ncbi:Conserved_hypothetical protein [Hexamita inflata]|uniref:Transmembrane protein n=1 Tax=Hexamita inflata TaxID=28002 RepID=A0AA86QJP1_9EUKA|nr:Conserved hypothetical protein [Hexamita inflata]
MLLIHSLQLNCFDINSSVTYLRQSRQVIFEAWQSSLLNQDQNYICKNIINNKQFSISVQIGTISFISTTLYTYDSSAPLQIKIDCSIPNQCKYIDVNQFSIAMFSLEFPQDKIIISSVAGSLKNRIFDHLGCKMSARATVSLVPGAESIMASTVPVQECRLAPITEIVRVVAYLKTNEISQTPINLTTFGLPLAIQPQYIKYVNTLPFVCATRPDQAVCIGLSKLMMQNEFFSFMGGTRNTINVRYQGGVQIFQQNVRFLFSNVQSAQPQDCFTKTTLTFYDKYLRVEADPGLCNQCSLAYFASFLSFDSAYLRFVMSINEDYSGFTYQNEYLVTDYSFGTKFDKMLTCEMMTDVHACQTQLPLLKQSLRQNSSVFLALVFKKDGAVVYKTLFTPTITETKIQSANVTLFDNKICIYFKPQGNEYVSVQVKMHDVKIDMQILTDTLTNKYCTDLSKSSQLQIQKITRDRLELVASATFGNQVVTDVQVTLIEKGDHPFFIWIIASGILVISFVTIVITNQCSK